MNTDDVEPAMRLSLAVLDICFHYINAHDVSSIEVIGVLETAKHIVLKDMETTEIDNAN